MQLIPEIIKMMCELRIRKIKNARDEVSKRNEKGHMNKMSLILGRSREKIRLYEPCKAAQSAEEHLWDTPADSPQSVLLSDKKMLVTIIST